MIKLKLALYETDIRKNRPVGRTKHAKKPRKFRGDVPVDTTPGMPYLLSLKRTAWPKDQGSGTQEEKRVLKKSAVFTRAKRPKPLCTIKL